MFSCFGLKKKNKSKSQSKKVNSNNSNSNSDDDNQINEEKQKELHEEYVKLKIKCESLQFENETLQRESMFFDSLIREYKINTHHFEKESMNEGSNSSENNIENFLKSEHDTLKAKHDLLTSDNNLIQAQFIEVYNELEKLTNPQSSEKMKLETKKFLLENIKQKKQSQLDYLTNKLSSLKKTKKGKGSKLLVDDIFLNNNEPPGLGLEVNMRNVSNENHTNSNSSESYDPRTNQNRGYYNEDPNRELIRKVLTETLEHSRGLYQKVYKANIDENAKFDEISKKIEEIKREIESIKNPQSTNAILTEAKSPIVKHEENKETKELKEKKEELQKNKTIIANLINEIDKTKKDNETLEKEILNCYASLSSKFSSSVKLEKQLEQIKAMRKK